jgi:hypothetical protein
LDAKIFQRDPKLIRAFVTNSSKFQQILTKNITFVILATQFSNALNTKLFKYSLLQNKYYFLLPFQPTNQRLNQKKKKKPTKDPSRSRLPPNPAFDDRLLRQPVEARRPASRSTGGRSTVGFSASGSTGTGFFNDRLLDPPVDAPRPASLLLDQPEPASSTTAF